MAEGPPSDPTVVLDLRELLVHVEEIDGDLVLVVSDKDSTVLLDPGVSGASPEAIAGAERCAEQAMMLAAALRTRTSR